MAKTRAMPGLFASYAALGLPSVKGLHKRMEYSSQTFCTNLKWAWQQLHWLEHYILELVKRQKMAEPANKYGKSEFIPTYVTALDHYREHI